MANLLSTSINGTLKVDSSPNAKRGFEFKQNGTNYILVPLTASSLDLGSQTLPFKDIYANNFKLTSNTGTTNTGNTNSNTFMQVSDDSTGKTSKIILGNEITTSETTGRAGEILLYGTGKGGTILETKQTKDTNNTISFPSKTGTVSLEGHSHAFKTTEFKCFCAKTNGSDITYTSGDKTKHYEATGDLYILEKNNDGKWEPKTLCGTITLRNLYGWGSDFLDIFVIRGYAEFTLTKESVEPNKKIRLGCLKSKKANYLPGGLVPLTIYRSNQNYTKGYLSAATNSSLTGYKDVSFIDIRCSSGLKKNSKYSLYFTATYGKIGESVENEDEDADDDTN